jgi:hypothetical protein
VEHELDDLEVVGLAGKISAALSKNAGHTVEMTAATESLPDFRIFVTTTEEGDHAVVMVKGSKVIVVALHKEVPEKIIWSIEIVRKALPSMEIEMALPEALEEEST